MSKAILIMDMPESCADCQLRNSVKRGYVICFSTLEALSEADYYDKKPEWCPLQELPEKMKTGTGEHGEKMFRAGFNACLDEILRKRNEQNE